MTYVQADRYLRGDYKHIQPPPPLRSASARVRQQTLGPVFSDEEDGDDSEYIAMRMKEMQMGQFHDHSVAHQMHQLQLQQQALAVQQQYLQRLIAQQPNHQAQRQVDPRIQAQLLSHLHATPQADLMAQAMAAQAQLQAQVQARALQARARARAEEQAREQVREQAREQAREQTRAEAKLQADKARFEAQPNITPEKTPEQQTVTLPESPPKPPLGRFAQARQTASSPFGELTALLARRSAEKPDPSEERLAARQGLQSIGLGRPAATATQSRAKSNPFPVSPNTLAAELPIRAVSLAPPTKPIRQPFGPPAPTNELGERNFQAMQRKKAGKGLEMLGRREMNV